MQPVHPLIVKHPQAAAFFDLDRTLIAGSSTYQFGRAAFKNGLIGRRELLAQARANLSFRLHGSSDETADALRERIGALLAGVRVRDLQRLAPDVLAGVLPTVYPEMLEIAYRHQDAGLPIFICTAAAQEMADLIATVLVFDGAIGSRAEVVDGYYTGRGEGPFIYRDGKAQAIAELAHQRGFDLANCWAYSDSESDLPMLQSVGHPVAVNPDRSLEQIAQTHGWEVLYLDRLGNRLRVAAAGATAATVGGLAALIFRRRRAPAPQLSWRERGRRFLSSGRSA